MTERGSNLDRDGKQRIDQHLRAVEESLTSASVSEGERRVVVGDLEDQILEMLSVRAGQAGRLTEVEAVLAELDPPEAYTEQFGSAQGTGDRTATIPAAVNTKPRCSRMAIAGAVWAGLWLCLTIVALIIVSLLGDTLADDGARTSLGLGPFVALLVPTAVGTTYWGSCQFRRFGIPAGACTGWGWGCSTRFCSRS